jgi:hypothetical protein
MKPPMLAPDTKPSSQRINSTFAIVYNVKILSVMVV